MPWTADVKERVWICKTSVLEEFISGLSEEPQWSDYILHSRPCIHSCHLAHHELFRLLQESIRTSPAPQVDIMMQAEQ